MSLVFNIQAANPEEMKEKVKALAILMGVEISSSSPPPQPLSQNVPIESAGRNADFSAEATTMVPTSPGALTTGEPKRRGRPPKATAVATTATTDIPSNPGPGVSTPTSTAATSQSLENLDADIFGDPVGETSSPPAQTEKAPSKEEVINILTEYKTKLSVESLRTMLLNQFDAARMSEVKEEDYGKLVQACKKAIAAI